MKGAGRTLSEKASRLQARYEERDYAACASALLELAIGLAALRWGVEFGSDALAAVPHLIWRDQRFGVGVWYLDLLRGGWESGETPAAPDDVDVLLGIYFLHCRGVRS
jgi:hypothetical protein